MEALIIFVVMHCGMPEVVIVDSSEEAHWSEVHKDERPRAEAFIQKMRDGGARVIEIVVKDDKCATST